ncbi:MAG: hypothetical protein ACREAA_17140 [Candidatus Polarisedimenticolia bacterium]
MKREAGHLLVGLMVLVAVMLILLTVAGQSWVFIMRRDAEAELIFRGEEYARAISFYQKETGSFPLELKLLMQPGPHRHRYIRKLYKDPLQEDGSWGKVYLSPTGKGFINPYASRRDLSNPFGDSGGGSFGAGPRGGIQAKTDPFADLDGIDRRKKSPGEDISGYSEMTPDEFEARGGEQQGLPIVGVVHKTKESGLKIYKNLANLNDWAFTTLLEGQETMGGPASGTKGVNVPLQKGIGDATNPFTLHPGAAPKERNLYQERENRRRQMLKDQREKEQREREEGGEDEQYEEDEEGEEDEDYEDEEPPDDEETQGEDEEGEGEEEDPNQPS